MVECWQGCVDVEGGDGVSDVFCAGCEVVEGCEGVFRVDGLLGGYLGGLVELEADAV